MSIDELSRPLPPAQSRRRQGIYWLCTIPFGDGRIDAPSWPYGLPEECAYIKGQLERGESTSYLHWQVLVIFKRKVSMRSLQESFCSGGHYELSRSSAADAYVWKEETRVPDSQFELGQRPFRRNSQQDWDSVWECAVKGRLLDIPASIRVINLLTLDL